MRLQKSFMHLRLPFLLATCCFALGPFGPTGKAHAGDARVGFNRQVRPLLTEMCFRCHGPDVRQRKADLRLDTEAGAKTKRDGEPAIVPGKPDDSELLRRVTSEDDAERMPPPGAGKP